MSSSPSLSSSSTLSTSSVPKSTFVTLDEIDFVGKLKLGKMRFGFLLKLFLLAPSHAPSREHVGPDAEKTSFFFPFLNIFFFVCVFGLFFFLYKNF